MYFFENFYYRGENMPKEHPYIARLKKQGKILKKQKNIISARALDEIAKQEGHSNWTALLREFDKKQD